MTDIHHYIENSLTINTHFNKQTTQCLIIQISSKRKVTNNTEQLSIRIHHLKPSQTKDYCCTKHNFHQSNADKPTNLHTMKQVILIQKGS